MAMVTVLAADTAPAVTTVATVATTWFHRMVTCSFAKNGDQCRRRSAADNVQRS
jgi:hypothetical protein